MARLTRKLENGRYAQNYTTGDGFFVGMIEMMQKLGELEDLQEAGRLVVLPEQMRFKDIFEPFRMVHCPSDFGLPEDGCCVAGECARCWEAALEGGGQE